MIQVIFLHAVRCELNSIQLTVLVFIFGYSVLFSWHWQKNDIHLFMWLAKSRKVIVNICNIVKYKEVV